MIVEIAVVDDEDIVSNEQKKRGDFVVMKIFNVSILVRFCRT